MTRSSSTARRISASFALVLAVALSACSGSGSGEPSTSGGASADGPVLDTGELTLGFTAPAAQLDPHKERPQERAYLYPIFDRLFQVTSDLKIEPMLAESYKTSADGLTVTLGLRSGVTFHDGSPMDAKAVVTSLERAKELTGSTVASLLTNVSSVTAAGDSTVTLKLKKPDSALDARLATFAGAVVNPAALQGDQLDAKATNAGSGPYRVTEFKPNESVTYAPAEEPWQDETGLLKKLTITAIPQSSARMAALRSGAVDAVILKQDQKTEATEIASKGQYVLRTYDSPLHYALLLQTDRSEFSNPKVRQAMSHAIDRATISEQLLNGDCTPTSQPWPTGVLGHDDALTDAYPFDTAKAKSLLAEAGLPKGFSFDAYVNNGLSPQTEIAQVLQAELKEVGITMNITPKESVEATTEFRAGNVDAYVHVVNGESDPSLTIDNYLTGGMGLAAEDSGLKQLADEGVAPKADREAKYQEISKLHSEQQWYLPICHQPTMWLFPQSVTGDEPLAMAWSGVFDPRYLAQTETP